MFTWRFGEDATRKDVRIPLSSCPCHATARTGLYGAGNVGYTKDEGKLQDHDLDQGVTRGNYSSSQLFRVQPEDLKRQKKEGCVY